MAGQDRRSSFDLKLNLLKEGHSFSYFQVIRLIRLFLRDADKIMNMRIRPELSLTFPSSDISRVEELPGEQSSFLVTAAFLGLYGVSSPLPTFYTEDLLREAAEDESIMRDFIDIINHRLYELFFHCLTKYHQFFQVVEEERPQYLQRLYCLLGIGEKELRDEVPGPYGLLRYIGLFSQFPRSALGLKTLLRDAFHGIPLEIIPCCSRKLSIPEDQRMYLGISGISLGENSCLGQEIEDRMNAFRIKIGPVNQTLFQGLLPGNRDFKKLSFLTRFYLTDPLDYDLDLTLSEGEVHTTILSGRNWSKLGLDTWVFSGDNYPDEARAVFYP